MVCFLIKSDISKRPLALWQCCGKPKAFMGSRMGCSLEKEYFKYMILKAATWLLAHWNWKKPLSQNAQQSKKMFGDYLLSSIPNAAVRPGGPGLDSVQTQVRGTLAFKFFNLLPVIHQSGNCAEGVGRPGSFFRSGQSNLRILELPFSQARWEIIYFPLHPLGPISLINAAPLSPRQ